jgi:transforming growth factor-beta-induced protein
MMRTVRSLVAVAATLFAVAACADSPTTSTDIQPSEELTLSSETAELRRGTQTIVGIAAGDTAFTTLVAAVVAADLVEALSGTTQLTVFAPTNAAFAKLGLDASNVGTLPKDALTDILLYHVTEGRRGAVSVLFARKIRMLSGDFTRVRLTHQGLFLNDSKVVAVNISASNGIVHVIDSVLLPPQD